MAGGKLEGQVLRCPSHGLKFDVVRGSVAGGGGLQLRTFPVRRDGSVAVVVLD
jgi:3-phenylpropionate/trans-cinnamate dioxygenase ferredoxin subunit